MAPVITPNFDENQGIQPGTYRARIVKCDMRDSKQGSQYLNWKFETVGGLFPGQWVYLMTGLTGKGAQKFKELVQACYDAKYESGAIDTDQMVGCELMITIDRHINPDNTPSKYMDVLSVSRAAVALAPAPNDDVDF